MPNHSFTSGRTQVLGFLIKGPVPHIELVVFIFLRQRRPQESFPGPNPTENKDRFQGSRNSVLILLYSPECNTVSNTVLAHTCAHIQFRREKEKE